MTHALDEALVSAARLISDGFATDDPTARARSWRKAAEIMVRARAMFFDEDGNPDWRARTYAYRQWASDVYDAAGVPKQERQRATSAIRYHAGNALRELLPDSAIEEAGLMTISPRERASETRAERTALLKSLTGASSGYREVDSLRALLACQTLVKKIDVRSLKDLPDEDRHKAAVAIKAIVEQATRARKAVTDPA